MKRTPSPEAVYRILRRCVAQGVARGNEATVFNALATACSLFRNRKVKFPLSVLAYRLRVGRLFEYSAADESWACRLLKEWWYCPRKE